ncbi:hypothetical protein ABZ678_21360 [Streptomyces hirsutus]|uniref:hypothetical protein n=1 Tax=Streptomyces hirsutus TaxID=35620 RepID=UPI0033D9D6F4
MVTSAVAWLMPGMMSSTLRRGNGTGDTDEAVNVAESLGGTTWSIDFGVHPAATLPVPGGCFAPPTAARSRSQRPPAPSKARPAEYRAD